MSGLKGPGKKLGAEEGKVRVDWEDLGFGMKMADGRHLHVAGGNSEGGILKGL